MEELIIVCVQTGSEAPPDSYPMERGRGVTLTAYPHLVTR
jgi:hypothetical protein